jgi:hypothetical protein
MWMGGQRHVPAALPPGKTQYPLYRKLVGTKNRSGGVRKISPQGNSIPGLYSVRMIKFLKGKNNLN